MSINARTTLLRGSPLSETAEQTCACNDTITGSFVPVVALEPARPCKLAALVAKTVVGLLGLPGEVGARILIADEVELALDLTLHHRAKADEHPSESGNARQVLCEDERMMVAGTDGLGFGVVTGSPEWAMQCPALSSKA